MELIKIRIGNDFILIWQIVRGEILEDLTLATDISMRYIVSGIPRPVPFELVGTNSLRVEVTPEIADVVGDYRFEVSYILPDLSVSDKNEKCRADVKAFTIVPLTEQAEHVTEITKCSDVQIGFRGKAFESSDFTEAEWTEIQRPSIEAGNFATGKGIYAGEQGDYAKEQGLYANSRGAYANEQGLYAKAQGDFANTKGAYADDKGLYAKSQGDFAKLQGEFAETATENANTSALHATTQGDYAKNQGIYANEKAVLADSKAQLAEQATIDTTAIKEEVETKLPTWESSIGGIENEVAGWRIDENNRKEAEIIRVENDKERIGSVSGTQEFNEINII